MENSDGFIPIAAIFYAVFHPTQGTKIVHQVPEGSISTIHERANTLFNFDTVKNYVIPKPHLCNKLISFKINKFKVIGYPVNIENDQYSRNSFNFNFCFVFPYDIGDVTPYEPAIRRMGKMFQVLEEQNFMLSKLDKDNSFFKKSNVSNATANTNIHMNTPGYSKTKRINLSSIESLINQIYQDLNNYSECCIPLDSANSVDIKLFPILPPPINIKAFQVPIATVKLNSLVDVNWDPTMIKILPYINGLNSVKKISELADANYVLTKQCIQHLMHYKCIEIIDIFQFGNIYAPTNHIGSFLKSNAKMAEECQAYVITSDVNYDTSSFSNTPNNSPFNTLNNNSPYGGSLLKRMNPVYEHSASKGAITVKVPSKATLFYLYRSLNQGQTVKEWYIQHRKLLVNVDIRRFINFGVLRGIIYRVHTYPILNSITRLIENNDEEQYAKLVDIIRKKHRPRKKEVLSRPKSSEGNLLKTRVNEQVLKTSQGKTKRKVSFNKPQKVKPLNDIILESDNEGDSDSDFSDGGSSNTSYHSEDELDSDEIEEERDMINLIKMLKGYQCFDSICTELQKSRAEVEADIEKIGSYSVLNG
ncbi:Nitrogen permease regulator 2 [Scheffersomyces stipitis CBS 6054]|uniref:Nitrogen permease regulator 2 n=1 Tax=Scheffersomyces stipitis (strain ATCC 58785 / CBS 6054 / NBRC 10063 / NRRL Y-11545) TaxID=322104 RepID=A3GHC2_PICST|nr:Nitrogen permease regulator 2 [Scheffersomyces stipitis CBS 6054]EAZ63028.2 Nitrogen permease regulator 2 [Scheffersomyces stipitis CBS 6054]